MKLEDLDQILNYELEFINYFIGYVPYILVASNDIYVRNFFLDKIDNNVTRLEDYELIYPKRQIIHDELKNNNVILIDFETKVENYIEFWKDNYKTDEDKFNAAYDALIPFRDKYVNRTIIIISNNEMLKKLADANLRSCMQCFMIDSLIKRKKFDTYKHDNYINVEQKIKVKR